MAEYEEDFMLRQAKQMAELLGRFMDKEDVVEIVELDKQQGEKLRQKKHQDLLNELTQQNRLNENF